MNAPEPETVARPVRGAVIIGVAVVHPTPRHAGTAAGPGCPPRQDQPVQTARS